MSDKTDMADKILKRLSALEEARQPWVGSWQELTDYMMPRKNSFGAKNPGKLGDERIFDSTPMHALELLAGGIGGLLTNPAMPWFEIGCRDKEQADRKETREFLQDARERMIGLFNAEDSGFQTHVHELYLDVALLGTAVMCVEADEDTVVRFSTRPLGEAFVTESVRGVVDTVFRKYEITARQAVQEWGGDCSKELKEKAEKKPETAIEIVHAVYPRTDRKAGGKDAGNFPFASIYLEAKTKHVLEESGYLEMPYMVPRWSKATGEKYGRGPGQTALSDTRVLNAMARTALMAAEKMSDPPLMVPDDGFLGPVRSGPGGLSYYRAGSTDRIEALPIRVDLAATESMMMQRRESIRRIFMGDQLAPEGPAVTATEAVIRQSEKMRVLGPVLGRLQSEFLTPLIRRVWNIMIRAGEVKFPEGVDSDSIYVSYINPIERSLKQYEAQGLMQAVEYLSPLVGESDPFGIMDNFNPDKIARSTQRIFGYPTDYLKPEKDVSASRQERAKAAQGKQALDEAGAVADIAKTASQADMSGPNAMTAILGQQPGGPRAE